MMTQTDEVTHEFTMRLQVAVRHDDEAKCFVSYCPMLDVYSAGTTEGEALEAIRSAISMFIRNCFQRKILDDFLTDKGFHLVTSSERKSDDRSAPWFIQIQRFGGQQFPVSVSMPFTAPQAERTCLQ